MISAVSIQHIYQSLALSRDIYGTFCFSSFTPASVAYICFSASLCMAVPTGECLRLCQQLPGSSEPPGPATLPLCQAPSRLTPSSTTMRLGDWCQQPVILTQAFSTWNETTFLGVVRVPCSLLWSTGMDASVHPLNCSYTTGKQIISVN